MEINENMLYFSYHYFLLYLKVFVTKVTRENIYKFRKYLLQRYMIQNLKLWLLKEKDIDGIFKDER